MNAYADHLAATDALKVGDFATYSIGGDHYPVEVIARTAKTITTRSAQVIRASGTAYREGAEFGTFVCAPKPNGLVQKFTRRASGRWCAVGGDYSFLSAGVTDRRDPAF